ncbi:MAG: antitoxin [Clostridium sp.]
MAKNQTILIRVTETQKDSIKRIAVSMKMTVTEFLLYGAMKSVSEMELNELIKSEAYGIPENSEYK